MEYKTVPIFLKEPKVLLIGGGKVAKQKAEVLIKNRAYFMVISEWFLPDFPECKRVTESFRESYLDGFSIVVDATGNPKVGDILKREKRKREFLLNRVDSPAECDFFFSSNIIQGDLKIAVSTSGSSPRAGQIIRNRIERDLPADLGELIDSFGEERREGKVDLQRVKGETEKRVRKAYLIGAGTGDPELLTIRAYKLIQRVDVIFYDHLISKEILDLIPETVEKISVGKQKGSHSKKQEEINLLLLEEINRGKAVARLKAGDPYIFGRGGEEALFLIRSGVHVEVVAGVSSSTSFGLPPTHRSLSSGFSVVSAHLKGNSVNLDWVPLLKMEKHTVVVLMGLSRVGEILEFANKLGVRKELPVAIISNISRPEEKRVITDLENLLESSKEAVRPAILVFGDIVNLEKELL
jgi:uroporphyrin-III C-methyltransferase/precorrin-2 dehydrogenase/sirohydrochlorin ferrochelatase